MNRELEIYYKKLLTNYIFNKLNIKDYERKLEVDYKDILILNDNGNYYELANNIYLNKLNNQELEYLKNNYFNKINYSKELTDFIGNTYPKVIRYSLNDYYKTYYESEIVDSNSFIDDDVIVFKIYYKENIIDDLKLQLNKIAKLVKDTKIYDDEISKILNNPVKTICIGKIV